MSASHITLVKDKIKRPWSFSGLATMIRILLMSYVSIQRFFEQPHRDWDRLITQIKAPPEELSLFWGGLEFEIRTNHVHFSRIERVLQHVEVLSDSNITFLKLIRLY